MAIWRLLHCPVASADPSCLLAWHGTAHGLRYRRLTMKTPCFSHGPDAAWNAGGVRSKIIAPVTSGGEDRLGDWSLIELLGGYRPGAVDRDNGFWSSFVATIEPMATLHESTDFAGNSELPKGWEDDVFRYCTLSTIHVEGKALEGVLSDCTISDSSWYWGLFNTTKFIGVKFRNCLFRGS
jgi:hypothetical protein